MKKKLIALSCLASIGLSSLGLSFADNSNQTSGMKVLENASKTSRSRTEYVGGGTWTYDSWIQWNGKGAMSDYEHPVNYHSSYSAVGSKSNSSGRVAGGRNAHSQVIGNPAYSAVVKWNNKA